MAATWAGLRTTTQRAEYRDFAHTGPGTLAGRYLRRFWHPVRKSNDLPRGRAFPIKIMNEDFTLYRGEGGDAHLVAFRCAHRGTQLSTGWVEGDNLRCFYHGWVYGPDGQCVEQPAEPEPFCQKIKIRSYPVREYLDLIFAYLGEGEPPPFPRFLWFEEDDGLSVNETLGGDTAPFNWFNNIDNDAPHLPFVHREPGAPFDDMISIRAEETEYGTCDYTSRPAQGLTSTTHHIMPNVRLFVSFPPPGGWREQITFDVPVDDQRYVSFGLAKNHFRSADLRDRWLERRVQPRPDAEEKAQNWSGKEKQAAVEIAARVLRGELSVHDLVGQPALVYIQDLVSQWGQGAIADRDNEHLGRSDSGVIAWRKIWERELRALADGRPLTEWRIPERLEMNGDFLE